MNLSYEPLDYLMCIHNFTYTMGMNKCQTEQAFPNSTQTEFQGMFLTFSQLILKDILHKLISGICGLFLMFV